MRDTRITVLGSGHAGLVTAAGLASRGHWVICADHDEPDVAVAGLLEPGLGALVSDCVSAGRLSFTKRIREAVADADAVFLCLPDVLAVVPEIRAVLPAGCVLVLRSTVPIGTADQVVMLLGRHDVPVVTNPGFVREGTAVRDFLQPDRIVVGCSDLEAGEFVAGLYGDPDVPVVITDQRTAEVAKYAATCFLAVKLSYINSIARLCELVDASASGVAAIMGYDHGIGPSHLCPGPGWGGSSLPDDTAALLRTADAVGLDFEVLRSAVEFNRSHQTVLAHRIYLAAGTGPVRIGVLGLTFKANTDNLRESPALAVTRTLISLGAEVTAYDPTVSRLPNVLTVNDAHHVAKGAHAIAVLTEWEEFRHLDWELMAQLMAGDVVIDTRNVLDHATLHDAGLRLHGFGG
ncbi:UDP-glucose 6-dehydrogenase [Lentzea sp. NBRC 105346]|uniref:UDP-glucose dehydrogenase family protein n=1 Tax=Lentzea sp. NBRC 105346 TaxID=3032205 RepID=UPI0024A26D16|nr:nucleotide sugar dehydrogenase [Lentzea sp. NBRC 105346]GLZ28577.1 UDP-glucose 6-dehydrogenase [Lentzea sp. NBRC 105346]